jgi:predicted RNase H-like nuclease (RuvC/YqgF family)
MGNVFDEKNNLSSEDMSNSCNAGLRYIFERGALIEKINRIETTIDNLNEDIKEVSQLTFIKDVEYLEKRLAKLESSFDKLIEQLPNIKNLKEEVDQLRKNEREHTKDIIKQGVKLGIIVTAFLLIGSGAVTLLFNIISDKIGG